MELEPDPMFFLQSNQKKLRFKFFTLKPKGGLLISDKYILIGLAFVAN